MLVSVSVKVPPVSGTELLLVTVNVMVDAPPALMVDGENALVMMGKLRTVKVALTPLASTTPDAGNPEIRTALLR